MANEKVWTSEQRVKAAFPRAYAQMHPYDDRLGFDITINSDPDDVDSEISGYFGNNKECSAWDDALTHPEVVAFESTLRVQDAPKCKTCPHHEHHGACNEIGCLCTRWPELHTQDVEGKPVLTAQDIMALTAGNHRCGWTAGPVKNPNPECGCFCGTVYAPDGHPIISHYGRGGPKCRHADERGMLKLPTPDSPAAKPLSPDSPKDAFEKWWKGYQPIRTMGETNYLSCAWAAWNAALRTRPEGEAKVEWRVEWRHDSGNVILFHAEDEHEARDRFGRDKNPNEEGRLICETVVETRKKEA